MSNIVFIFNNSRDNILIAERGSIIRDTQYSTIRMVVIYLVTALTYIDMITYGMKPTIQHTLRVVAVS